MTKIITWGVVKTKVQIMVFHFCSTDFRSGSCLHLRVFLWSICAWKRWSPYFTFVNTWEKTRLSPAHFPSWNIDTLVSMKVGTLLKCCVPDWFKSRDNLLDRRWTLIKKLIVVCIHEGNKALQHLHASQFLASAYALQHFAVTRHYEMWPTQNRITYRKKKSPPS